MVGVVSSPELANRTAATKPHPGKCDNVNFIHSMTVNDLKVGARGKESDKVTAMVERGGTMTSIMETWGSKRRVDNVTTNILENHPHFEEIKLIGDYGINIE